MTRSTLLFRFLVAPACLGLISGCALPIQSELETISGLTRYVPRYGHVVGAERNLLDRALAECPEKTVKAENLCVRQAVDGSHVSPKTLIAMVPNCAEGRLCPYEHTTRDRLGFVPATATDYVNRWRVDLDFRHPAADVTQVPITVADRDDFDSLLAAKAAAAKTAAAKASSAKASSAKISAAETHGFAKTVEPANPD